MAVAANFSHERRLALIEISVGLIALFLGTLYGPLQALEQMGINLYWLVPWTQTYYQGLTLHGVLNALVWTTWFITGFLTYVTVYSLNRNLRYGWIGTLGLVLMAINSLCMTQSIR